MVGRRKEQKTINGEDLALPVDLRPMERAILKCGVLRAVAGTPQFYGYEIHRSIMDDIGKKESVTKSGSIYKALKRLEGWGMLESQIIQKSGRARILYSVTPAGASRIL